MTGGPVPAHWIKPNELCRIPNVHIVFDTEARRQVTEERETQTWRLGVAAEWHRRSSHEPWTDPEMATFATPAELWDWVDERCRRRGRTVMAAHNLGYDLRTSRAFEYLPTLGWRMTMARIDRGAAWINWRKGERTLQMVDTVTWVGVGLAEVGEALGIPKLTMPRWSAPDDVWLRYCANDVAIMVRLWQRIVAWIEDDDLGNFKPTGAGQAWAAWRHRFLTHKVLAHDDATARQAEREAAWTGRCEAWRHGPLEGGPWFEYDWRTQYAVIGRDCDVPTKLCGHLQKADISQVLELSTRYRIVARCEVAIGEPVVPTRGPHGILWPTGWFTTTLWDAELVEAVAAGADIKISEAWLYRRDPAISAFCRWVIDQLNAPPARADRIVAMVLKGWSRSLIGRFGARWPTWQSLDDAPEDYFGMYRWMDEDGGPTRDVMHLGRQLLMEAASTDAPDSAPQVMSWIMSEARARLWQIMRLAGFDHLAYVDTDSIVVDWDAARRVGSMRIAGLRFKERWDGAVILGPRQVIVAGRARAAGIPRTAVRGPDGRWHGVVWRQLRTALDVGETDRVVLTPRAITMGATDHRRVDIGDGLTDAITVNTCGEEAVIM